MLASWLDSRLNRRAASVPAGTAGWRPVIIDTPVGPVRASDTGSDKPCVVLVPDGPNVIEHHVPSIGLLAHDLRVVCFDMPGFGFSPPRSSYRHSLDQGAGALLGVLDRLGIARATLAVSCANGFYALRAAQLAPDRIASLFLSQTPSLAAMHGWVGRVVPRPLTMPAVGQLAGWLFRRQAALRWYDMALPEGTDREAFRGPTRQALRHGGCFCLAGVVQGLLREAPGALDGVTVPCTMVWGSRDRSHRRTDPGSLLGCVPHAQIVHFDDCGHFPDLEQPARHARLLLDHVASLAPVPPGNTPPVRVAEVPPG